MTDASDEAEIDLYTDNKVSSVILNKKYDEIREHIINETMDMKAIVRNYSNPEWGEFTYWALYDHKRTKLQPLIDKKREEIEEEVGEAMRKLIYDKKDVLESLLAYAVEAMQSGTLRIRTVNELVKVTDQLFRLAGEGEYNTIKMKAGWGDKLEKSPRTKGKVFTAEDFDVETPEDNIEQFK
jgi:hypothetical protein